MRNSKHFLRDNSVLQFAWLFRIAIVGCLALLTGCASYQDGSNGLGGRAIHQKVSSTDYTVRAITNGFSGPARLRPLIHARASELAAANGFTGFALSIPVVEFDPQGAFIAYTSIKLTNSEVGLPPNLEYFTATTSASEEAIDSSLPVLAGGKVGDTGDASLHVFPLYFAAVKKKESGFHSESFQVLPGDQTIVSSVLFKPSTFSRMRQGSVPFRVRLEPGKAYRVTGRIVSDSVDVWLEETGTARRLAQARLALQ